MPYYKEPNDALHYLESSEFEYLLPADCIAITDEEAKAIQVEIEANQPIVIPDISMRQARLALLADGLLDDIEAAITQPDDKIWWDYSTTVERQHPLVDTVLAALGKTSEDIDQMFIEAAKL